MTDIGVVDLAHTADFRLGDILVRPARRQLVSDCGKTELLQPRVMQVLVVLAQAEGAVVTREELLEACWRGLIVGDDSINRVISQLRRAMEAIGEGSVRIETVPKIGYRIDTPPQRRADSPSAVAPLLAFEPESPEAEPTQFLRRAPWVPSGWMIAVALIALLGAGVWRWNAGLDWPWGVSEGPHIAVAPFEVIGRSDAAREMAKAIVSDSVSDLGAKSVQTVAVTSVSSAPRSVHLVLNGEVQQTPTDARVTLHLFDPHARAILWSGEITGDPTHLASLQQQASLKAADMLTCGLDAFAPNARLDAEARAQWLRMCDTWRQRGTLGQARDAMRALMQRVPSFSGAYAKYALATARMISNGSFSDVRAARDEARAAALHALALSPDDADAYIALSVTEPATDWLAREQWLRRGLAHQPNSSDLLSWRAALLATLGRPSEVLPLARRGVELDPHSAVKTVNLAVWLSFAGETAEAAKVEQAARLTWPQSPDLLDWEFEQAVRRGDAATVLERLSSPQTRPVDMLDPEALLWPKIMAGRHGSAGDRLVLARQIADLMERRQFNDFWGFLALHMLNEDDAAYALMLKMSKGGTDVVIPEDIATVLFQPEMASVRSRPRFMDLAANLGLTAYWLRSGRWPDFCSDPDLAYSCASQARVAEKARGTPSQIPPSSGRAPAR